MATNNEDILRSMMIFEGKETKKEEKKVKKDEKLDEFKMKPTPASKKGMFKGKTKAELRTELANVKKRMKSIEDSGKKVPKALRTKFSELTFALRAKHNWGTAESKEAPKKKKTVKESFNFEAAIDKMLAENFWGGEESGNDSPISGNEDHSGEESEGGSEENKEDVLKIDVPTFIKFLEFAREDSTGDDELHEIAEKLVQCCGDGGVIDMEKFEELCCMNHDGGEEVGANSEAGDEDRETPEYGNEESEEDSGSGSEESDTEEEPNNVAESIRALINRLNY
jgi:hypothetical protein